MFTFVISSISFSKYDPDSLKTRTKLLQILLTHTVKLKKKKKKLITKAISHIVKVHKKLLYSI